MNTRSKLLASPRTVLGKAVKRLRLNGQLPAHIYGRGLTSESITVQLGDFQKIYQEVGETGVFDLEVSDKRKPVLIQGVTRDPLTEAPLHIDFYAVNLKEKVKVTVPLLVVGESPAVIAKEVVLEQPVGEIEIEALPTDIPENIPVDITGLDKIDAQLTVADLKVDLKRVTILTSPEVVVAKAGPLLTEEMQQALEAEKAASEAATTVVAAEASSEETLAAEETVSPVETTQPSEQTEADSTPGE